MSFKPIQKLAVTRTLSSSEQVAVGVLAQNRQGVFFQYADSYLQQFGNLSPLLCKRAHKFKPHLERLIKEYMAYLQIVCPMAGACCCKIVFSGKRASCLIN